MKIVEGWRGMIRAVELSGMASHLGPIPVEVWREEPSRLVALVLGFVVVRFSVATAQ
jgi:hypothetical protein